MAEKLSWYQKLVAKLAAIGATDGHKQKPEFAPYEWQPGNEPLIDVDGRGRNFCTAPNKIHFNTADRVNCARQQHDPNYRSPEDNSDPWAAANDPALAHYDTPPPPPAVGGPDDPAYITN